MAGLSGMPPIPRGILGGPDWEYLMTLILQNSDVNNGSLLSQEEWEGHCRYREKWAYDDFRMFGPIAGAGLLATIAVPATAAAAGARFALGSVILSPEALVIISFGSLASLTTALIVLAWRRRRAALRWRSKLETGNTIIRRFLPC